MILENKKVGHILEATILITEANLTNAEQFKQEMFDLINKGNQHISLNFVRVTYIDSSFLGAMVSSLKHALGKGAEIYLTDLKKDIIDLLRLIRVDKVFKIYERINDITGA